VPILQEFYLMGMRCGEKSRRCKFMELQISGLQYAADKEGKRKAAAITEDTRWSFARAYGILPHEQVALEEHIRATQISLVVQQAPGTNYQTELSQAATPIALDSTIA
jgi:hypothetical protein